jgi:hypothetical protein
MKIPRLLCFQSFETKTYLLCMSASDPMEIDEGPLQLPRMDEIMPARRELEEW